MFNTSPVIVVGNPRSGTRMCANILNTHPDICITDEILNVGMLDKLAEQQISSLIKKRVDPQTIPLRKELMIKNYWLMRSNLTQIEKSRSASIIGNKTPRAEHHYSIYEEIFSVHKPLYVYCARNALDVLRSIKNLKNIQWSELPFEELFENYKKSYRVLEEMKNKFPDRVFVVNVDDYKNEKLYSFYKEIFDALGLECSDTTITKINNMGVQNSMEKVKSITKDNSPIVELTAEEVSHVENCREYKRILVSLSNFR